MTQYLVSSLPNFLGLIFEDSNTSHSIHSVTFANSLLIFNIHDFSYVVLVDHSFNFRNWFIFFENTFGGVGSKLVIVQVGSALVGMFIIAQFAHELSKMSLVMMTANIHQIECILNTLKILYSISYKLTLKRHKLIVSINELLKVQNLFLKNSNDCGGWEVSIGNLHVLGL